MDIIIASNNNGKIKEINNFLKPLGINAKSIKEYFGKDIDVPETEETYLGNSKLKAKYIYDLAKIPVLADDSGLEIEAMPGELGVYTARYLGKDASFEEKLESIYNKTKGKSQNLKYVCCFVLYLGEEYYLHSQSEVLGKISNVPKGSNGFAYDKIFYYKEFDKTFAEMSTEEKNKISHRAKALEKLVIKMKEKKILN